MNEHKQGCPALGGYGTADRACICKAENPPQEAFRRDLQAVLNKHSRENASNTPDFLLADYLIDCLRALDMAISNRAGWYGRYDKPGRDS